jgi:hypothetical protein
MRGAVFVFGPGIPLFWQVCGMVETAHNPTDVPPLPLILLPIQKHFHISLGRIFDSCFPALLI